MVKKKTTLEQIMFLIVIIGGILVIKGAWDHNVLMIIVGIVLIVIRGLIIAKKSK